MNAMWITIIILLLTILAFISGKIPMSIISMGIIVLLIVFKILPVQRAFSGFINSNVIMFAGMFVIGAGIMKTNILTNIEKWVMKFKNKPKRFMLISCIVAAVLGLLTSATAAVAILLPLLIGMSTSVGISRQKLLYPAAVVANIATGSTFLGVGASNMAWSSIMMKVGAKQPLSILSFTWSRLPFLIVAIVYMAIVAPRFLPNRDNKTFNDNFTTKKNTKNSLSPVKEKIAVWIIVITIILMILSTTFNIPIYLISTIGAMALVIFGVLSEKEALSSLNLPTIFLFAGVLALSDALQVTGAGNLIANLITNIVGKNSNSLLVMAIFFTVPFIVTQFMSNLATIAIFIPLITTTALKMGFDPRAAVLAVVTASCCSFLTPLASPPQTMIMGPGGYKLVDYLKAGWPLALIFIILGTFWFQVIYPL